MVPGLYRSSSGFVRRHREDKEAAKKFWFEDYAILKMRNAAFRDKLLGIGRKYTTSVEGSISDTSS